MKTSSVVEKTLNKYFQTSCTFFFLGGGSKCQTSNDLFFTPQFKSRNKHSSTPCPEDREFPSGLYLMERRNTCLTIRKLLVLACK